MKVRPGNIANARGEKAVANFDEDSITMAVAAGIDALKGSERSKVEGVYFGSTTMPYKERLNAGIITAALGLNDQVRSADFSGGFKAGTTALLSALDSVEAKQLNNVVVTSSDCRLGKPASPQELIFGDAAAALLVGRLIVLESVLSFLGLGVQPPFPSLGSLLYGAQNALASEPWLALFPGIWICLLVLSVNLLGDSLNKTQ